MEAGDALKSYRQSCEEHPGMGKARDQFLLLGPAEQLELVFLMLMANNHNMKQLYDRLGLDVEVNRPADRSN